MLKNILLVRKFGNLTQYFSEAIVTEIYVKKKKKNKNKKL